MSYTNRKMAEESAEIWNRLAKQEREKLNWDKHAIPQAVNARATMYENTAKAVIKGYEMNEPYCVCHVEPMRICAQRKKS